ncbi:MAG: hypothetical protein M3Y23_04185 [Actinomycetota bacterium]|nr:hypothetical protein [Actinomycetota bacterium]
MLFRGKKKKGAEELFDEIDQLTAANRAERDPANELKLRELRHLAGIALVDGSTGSPSYPEPAAVPPARDPVSKLPEITPEQLTPELLRAAILDSGCLLVRGLMDRETALGLAGDIEKSFATRIDLKGSDRRDPQGFYDELEPEKPYEVQKRDWIEEGGGVLAADSPKMFFDMLDSFERVKLRQVIEGYLGERPAVTADKCTLRKATPDVVGAWHQDGKFMGDDIRAMNIWLSLSDCGGDNPAPGMDLVPRRLDGHVAAGTEGTFFPSQVSQAVAEEAAGEFGIVNPSFAPGDALLFDDIFLHQTGGRPGLTEPRYAIESWFFGPSAFPEIYVPLAF